MKRLPRAESAARDDSRYAKNVAALEKAGELEPRVWANGCGRCGGDIKIVPYPVQKAGGIPETKSINLCAVCKVDRVNRWGDMMQASATLDGRELRDPFDNIGTARKLASAGLVKYNRQDCAWELTAEGVDLLRRWDDGRASAAVSAMIPHNVALSVDETDQMSDLLQAKYIARADELTPTLIEATSVVLAARLSRYLYDQRNRPDENETLRDACVFCEGLLMEDRVTVDKRNHVVTPCWACRPRAFCAYHAMIARHEESQAAEHFCCGHYLGYLRECPTCKAPCRCSGCKADDAPATLRTGQVRQACGFCGKVFQDGGPTCEGFNRSVLCSACVDAGHLALLANSGQDLTCQACRRYVEHRKGRPKGELERFIAEHREHGQLSLRTPTEPSPFRWIDRGEPDLNDNKSDIQPFESTTTYPWGRHGDD